MTDRVLNEYALQIAEGYISFVHEHDPHEDIVSAEAYARGVINNDMRRIIAEVVEAVNEMGDMSWVWMYMERTPSQAKESTSVRTYGAGDLSMS